jgi:hypothetical protein
MYLEKREDWGSEFPNIPIELFSKVREKLFKDVHLTNKVYKYEVHQNALKDAGMSY